MKRSVKNLLLGWFINFLPKLSVKVAKNRHCFNPVVLRQAHLQIKKVTFHLMLEVDMYIPTLLNFKSLLVSVCGFSTERSHNGEYLSLKVGFQIV